MDFIVQFNEAWVWLALSIVFLIIEAFTTSLVTIWFAIGSAIVIFVSFLPIPFVWQVVIFLVISILLLILTRPVLAKKLLKNKEKTNVDSLVGKKVLVTKTIKQFEKGEIKVNGVIWSAKTEDNATIEENVECEIIAIEGVTAIVKHGGNK